MQKANTTPTPAIDISQTIKNLEETYYVPGEKMCGRLMKLARKLKDEDKDNSLSVFSSMFISLINQLQAVCEERMLITVPYITSLVKKAATKHNCLNCSDDCGIKHKSQIARIEKDHYSIRDVFARLQKIAPVLYSEDEVLPSAYKTLRKEMMALNTFIYEMIYLEESSLIPAILESQRQINATN